jgi:glycosyltransferase involved in cell wall biosynthesis
MAAADVLFVIGSLTIGGTEKQLAMLTKGLKARGWQVAIFAFDASGVLAGELQRAGIRIVDGGYRSSQSRFRKIATLLACQLSLTTLLRRERPRVVHGFLPPATFVSALAARLARTQVSIISKRAMGTHQERIPVLKWLDRTANRMAGIVTANSVAVAEDTAARDGYPLADIIVIPNGLDFTAIDRAAPQRDEMRRKLGIAQDEIAITMVANLIPYKGHADLIRAFALLAPDRRAKLFLIGRDDGIGASLTELAANLGIGDRMFALGQRDDVASLLSAMDIGVMTSDQEGLSNAVLEKLGSGLPVVATSAGGNREALEGMPGCVLVRLHDPDDLARGLSAVIANMAFDNRGVELRRLARERYSVDGMVEAHEQLYERLYHDAIGAAPAGR